MESLHDFDAVHWDHERRRSEAAPQRCRQHSGLSGDPAYMCL